MQLIPIHLIPFIPIMFTKPSAELPDLGKARMRATLIGLALLAAASGAGAQLRQARPIGRVDAVSRDSFSTQATIRPLSDGRVIVNDPVARRLVLLDARLGLISVLFDATTPPPLTYPRGTVHLMGALGDTSFLGDPGARGFRVIDRAGVVVRRQSLLNMTDIAQMMPPPAGATVDPLGRIVFAQPVRPLGITPGGPPRSAEGLNIVRVSLDKPVRDTLFFLKATPGSNMVMTVRMPVPTNGAPPVTLQMPTLPFYSGGDAWALTSDGAVAVVHASDYHVEWIDLAGARRSTPPVSWPWNALSDSQKQRLSDSVQIVRVAWQAERAASNTASSGLPPGMILPPPTFSSTVPDTVPPFVPGSARGDLNGRIWVHEGPSINGLPPGNGNRTYDIIDKTGQIVDRVQLPDGTMLAGFGPKGLVYLLALKNHMTVTIERAVLPPH